MSRSQMRSISVAAVVCLLAAAAWFGLGIGGDAAMPSYFAAWLFWLAIPLGALPLVLALEASLATPGPLVMTLRRVLLLLPVGAVLAIPVLFQTAALFRRPGVEHALPIDWMAPTFFVARDAAILVILSALALVFSQAPRSAPRRGLAIFGLMVHFSLVSVLAVDWILSLQPGLGSSGIGLLMIVSQASVAASLAAFIIAVGTRNDAALPTGLGMLLTALLALWGFMNFTQYLIVWSANLPAEIVWYQLRVPGLGTAAVWLCVTAALLGLALLPTRIGRIPAVTATLAATILLAHLTETFWLVTPVFRGSFAVTLADCVAVLGLGALLVVLILAALAFERREVRHAGA